MTVITLYIIFHEVWHNTVCYGQKRMAVGKSMERCFVHSVCRRRQCFSLTSVYLLIRNLLLKVQVSE